MSDNDDAEVVIYKEGHKVQVTGRQFDEKGICISEESATWFGFSNDDANDFHMALVGGTFEVADAFKDAKKSGNPPVITRPIRPGKG